MFFFQVFWYQKGETLGDKKPPNSIAKVDVPSKRFVLVVLMNSFGQCVVESVFQNWEKMNFDK